MLPTLSLAAGMEETSEPGGRRTGQAGGEHRVTRREGLPQQHQDRSPAARARQAHGFEGRTSSRVRAVVTSSQCWRAVHLVSAGRVLCVDKEACGFPEPLQHAGHGWEPSGVVEGETPMDLTGP